MDMKIVMLEAATLGSDMDVSVFEKYGDFTVYDATDVSQASQRIQDAQIIIVNKLPMNASTLAEANNVQLICVTATGTNNIDFDYVNSRNIAVTNAAGYSTASVAQHTFALYFYVAEKLRYYDDFVKSGAYEACSSFTHFSQYFHELEGKTWGIIGLGAIGRKTADIAKAYGCRVIYYSSTGNNASSDYQQVDFDTLLRESDVISIHCPLNDTTEHLIDGKAFSKMKKSAILINVARGPIIHEADLYDALTNNQIAGAGLDVLSTEPMTKDNPLAALKDSNKLVITPHIGWASTEARIRLIHDVCKNIESFQKGEKRNRVC